MPVKGFLQPVLIHSVKRCTQRAGSNEQKMGRRKCQRVTADFV